MMCSMMSKTKTYAVTTEVSNRKTVPSNTMVSTKPVEATSMHLVVSISLSVSVTVLSVQIRIDMAISVASIMSRIIPVIGSKPMNIDSGGSMGPIHL